MRKRNADGTWRSARKASSVSDRVSTARWVEAETLRLKRLGLSFDAIAEQITKIGRGEAQAMVTISDGVTFPPDYHISRQACCKAFRKAIMREPNLEAMEMRLVDTDRCEDLFLSLQAGIRKGDPRSIEVAVKVLSHKSEINGYKAPAKVEMTGKQGGPLGSRPSGNGARRRRVKKLTTRIQGTTPKTGRSPAGSLLRDPALFARIVLGADLWQTQREILTASRST